MCSLKPHRTFFIRHKNSLALVLGSRLTRATRHVQISRRPHLGVYFFLPPPQGLTNSISPVRELTCLFLICLSCFLLMVFILCVLDICKSTTNQPGAGTTCYVSLQGNLDNNIASTYRNYAAIDTVSRALAYIRKGGHTVRQQEMMAANPHRLVRGVLHLVLLSPLLPLKLLLLSLLKRARKEVVISFGARSRLPGR